MNLGLDVYCILQRRLQCYVKICLKSAIKNGDGATLSPHNQQVQRELGLCLINRQLTKIKLH